MSPDAKLGPIGADTALMEDRVQDPAQNLPYYLWEVQGKPLSARLSFNLIDKLSMEVMRGFGAVPRRGAEVGGVLLGTIETRDKKMVVSVEEFLPVICDYKRGPSFLLTEVDWARFGKTVSANAAAADKPLYAVGFYRSHTREGLGLCDEDLQLFKTFLDHPANVILLVRPFATKPSVGAVFFEESGGFRRESSYLEFPFKRRDLGGGSSPALRSVSAVTDELPFLPPEETPMRGWKRDRVEGLKASIPRASPVIGRWAWIPLSVLLLLLGGVLGFQAAFMVSRGNAQRIARRSLALGLSAEEQNDKVSIRWDRNSAAVLNAKQGSLHIQDGDFFQTVPLDARALQGGGALYPSVENKASFRLSVVTEQGGTISETIEFQVTARQR